MQALGTASLSFVPIQALVVIQLIGAHAAGPPTDKELGFRGLAGFKGATTGVVQTLPISNSHKPKPLPAKPSVPTSILPAQIYIYI